MQTGAFRLLPAPDGALAWERTGGGDRRLVAVNFTDAAVDIDVSGDWVVEVASDGSGEGERATGRPRQPRPCSSARRLRKATA